MLSQAVFSPSQRSGLRPTGQHHQQHLSAPSRPTSSISQPHPKAPPRQQLQAPTYYAKRTSHLLVVAAQAPHNVAGTVETQGQQGASPKRIGVLFVCLGNICRSPTAEAMFRTVVQRNGLEDRFDIDSCGTGGGSPDWYKEGGWSYHEGDASDSRMMATAKRRGVALTSTSRPLVPADLARFEYVIGMDPKNIRAIQTAGAYWAGRQGSTAALQAVPADYQARLSLMTDYCVRFRGAAEVPDPYYGGTEGFEKVLDLLDDASQGLLEAISQARRLK